MKRSSKIRKSLKKLHRSCCADTEVKIVEGYKENSKTPYGIWKCLKCKTYGVYTVRHSVTAAWQSPEYVSILRRRGMEIKFE